MFIVLPKPLYVPVWFLESLTSACLTYLQVKAAQLMKHTSSLQGPAP